MSKVLIHHVYDKNSKSSLNSKYHRQVVINFVILQSLTNWGRDKLVTDLTPDEDSIQIVAFFSYMGGSETLATLSWRLDYGNAYLEGYSNVTTVGSSDAYTPVSF